MSASEIITSKPNSRLLSAKSKNGKQPEESSQKSAKERLLFSKCTC